MLKGARIDAIGMQFHMFFPREKEYAETRPFYDPQNLYRHMDLYANFGKPLQITEVTIPAYSYDAADEEMQAEILKRLYSIWFSYKNVEQIVYWNLADGYAAFAPQGDMTAGENYYHGGLLRFDLSKKPAYFALRDLIQKEWHTETEAVTDMVGKADFRGFYGKYDVVIEHDGKTMQKELNLSAKGKRDFTFEL
ncbi:MAG: endo-1,4-beta-xylanase [Firmicutes bacterium]|nr:endo-1,4-beta-xylanase [Bacillota bacterium]